MKIRISELPAAAFMPELSWWKHGQQQQQQQQQHQPPQEQQAQHHRNHHHQHKWLPAISATRPKLASSNSLQALYVHVMEAKRLLSCLGYAWRLSFRLGDVGVGEHLFCALQALRQHQPVVVISAAQPMQNTPERTPISLFDALGPPANCCYLIQAEVEFVPAPNTSDQSSQTDFEVTTQLFCEDIAQLVRSQMKAQIQPLI